MARQTVQYLAESRPKLIRMWDGDCVSCVGFSCVLHFLPFCAGLYSEPTHAHQAMLSAV